MLRAHPVPSTEVCSVVPQCFISHTQSSPSPLNRGMKCCSTLFHISCSELTQSPQQRYVVLFHNDSYLILRAHPVPSTEVCSVVPQCFISHTQSSPSPLNRGLKCGSPLFHISYSGLIQSPQQRYEVCSPISLKNGMKGVPYSIISGTQNSPIPITRVKKSGSTLFHTSYS